MTEGKAKLRSRIMQAVKGVDTGLKIYTFLAYKVRLEAFEYATTQKDRHPCRRMFPCRCIPI